MTTSTAPAGTSSRFSMVDLMKRVLGRENLQGAGGGGVSREKFVHATRVAHPNWRACQSSCFLATSSWASVMSTPITLPSSPTSCEQT